MTSIVNYRRRGRIVIAGYAWYKFGNSIRDGSLIGATSWGIVAVEATVSVFIPDPVATGIGWAGTKIYGRFANTISPVLRGSRAFLSRVMSVPYLVPVSIALAGRATLEKEGFYEDYGAAAQQEIIMTDLTRTTLYLAEANAFLLQLNFKDSKFNNLA